MKNITLALAIALGFCATEAEAQGKTSMSLCEQEAQQVATNDCVRRKKCRLFGNRKKSAKQIEKEAREMAIRQRYDERVTIWKNTYGNKAIVINKFEFWGFVFGSTYSETFPGEKLNVGAQAQGLTLISRSKNLKEKKLGFDHACINFTPCTLLLGSITFYWSVGRSVSNDEINKKIMQVRDRLATEYGFSVTKEETRDGRIDVHMEKGCLKCNIFLHGGIVYLGVSHRDIQFRPEQTFIGVIDDDVWKSKVVAQSEISDDMRNAVSALRRSLSYESTSQNVTNMVAPVINGIAGVVFGETWVPNRTLKSRPLQGTSVIGADSDFDSCLLGSEFGVFKICDVIVSPESHTVYAVSFYSGVLNIDKQEQAIKDFDAIIGLLEEVCDNKFVRDYRCTYKQEGEYINICDFHVLQGPVDIFANLIKSSKGLEFHIWLERVDVREKYRLERKKLKWQKI